MSTKIYNAYEWRASLPSLMGWLYRIRADYILYAEAIIERHYKQRGYEKTRVELKRQMVLVHPTWDDGLAFADAVVLYPRPTRVLLQAFFSVKMTAADSLFKHRSIRDFHYQNQTDRPAHVSPAQWEARRRTWESVFGEYGTPAEAGLQFRLLHPMRAQGVLNTVVLEDRKKGEG